MGKKLTEFAKQQKRLRELVEKVGFSASLRNLTSALALEYAVLEEGKKKQKTSQCEIWTEIAAILESRGK